MIKVLVIWFLTSGHLGISLIAQGFPDRASCLLQKGKWDEIARENMPAQERFKKFESYCVNLQEFYKWKMKVDRHNVELAND